MFFPANHGTEETQKQTFATELKDTHVQKVTK